MKLLYEDVLSGCCNAGGATDEQINCAEKELEIEFPASYRDFLKRYGAVMGAGFEIAGVFESSSETPPMWKDVVTATKQIRRSGGYSKFDTLIPISGDGVSLTYFLVVSDKTKSPVVAIGPNVDCEEISKSFEEFVLKLSKDDFNEL